MDRTILWPPGVGIEHQPYPVSCRVPTTPLRAPQRPLEARWYLYPPAELAAIVGQVETNREGQGNTPALCRKLTTP